MSVAPARMLPRLLVFFSAAALAASAQWTIGVSGTQASLRGISAVSASVAWASGTQSTVLRTLDGGKTWSTLSPPAGEPLDFRDIEAFDRDTAIVMSAGPGDKSRLYRTTNGGQTWTLLLRNQDESGFFDAIAFWDRSRGLVLGDAVNGRMVVLRTEDGGAHWERVAAEKMPAAQEGEGAFAASGTALALGRDGRAWFGTGGPGGGRVFRSADGGRSWTVAVAPIRHDDAASGIFSIAFFDDRAGVIVGGNYKNAGENRDNVALTADGGLTWTASRSHPGGYRSAVALLRKQNTAIATGVSGTDISTDGGKTWSPFAKEGFHALAAHEDSGVVFAVGDEGTVSIRRSLAR